MDDAVVIERICREFDNVQTQTVDGATFFFYAEERKFPFATLVTRDDAYDSASNLSRPGVFRLNVGVGKGTYESLFGSRPPRPGATGIVDTGHDFTALDQLFPHPVYAPMGWLSVLCPSEATFETLRPLLAEAYGMATDRQTRREARE